jgi:hypothetical protein
MELVSEEMNVEKSQSEEVEFGIGDTDFMIDLARSQLYTNPLRIFPQEYMANARDANIEAGKSNTPIEIHLPNAFDSTLRIRDFGEGMSKDTVKTIFTQYGVSTKRDKNNQTGGFGIGSKSAWSYTDSFTISTIFEGVRYQYIAYLDDNRRGKLSFQHSEKTDEESGTTISVDINTNDYLKLREYVVEISKFWKVRPKIFKGQEEIVVEAPKNRKFEWNKNSVLNYDNSTIVVDEIPYVLNFEILEAGFTYFDKEECEDKEFELSKSTIMFLKNFIVFTSSKDIKPAPNRSDINYHSLKTFQKLEEIATENLSYYAVQSREAKKKYYDNDQKVKYLSEVVCGSKTLFNLFFMAIDIDASDPECIAIKKYSNVIIDSLKNPNAIENAERFSIRNTHAYNSNSHPSDDSILKFDISYPHERKEVVESLKFFYGDKIKRYSSNLGSGTGSVYSGVKESDKWKYKKVDIKYYTINETQSGGFRILRSKQPEDMSEYIVLKKVSNEVQYSINDSSYSQSASKFKKEFDNEFLGKKFIIVNSDDYEKLDAHVKEQTIDKVILDHWNSRLPLGSTLIDPNGEYGVKDLNKKFNTFRKFLKASNKKIMINEMIEVEAKLKNLKTARDHGISYYGGRFRFMFKNYYNLANFNQSVSCIETKISKLKNDFPLLKSWNIEDISNIELEYVSLITKHREGEKVENSNIHGCSCSRSWRKSRKGRRHRV